MNIDNDGNITYATHEIHAEIAELAVTLPGGMTGKAATDYVFNNDLDDLPDEQMKHWLTWNRIDALASLLPGNPKIEKAKRVSAERK